MSMRYVLLAVASLTGIVECRGPNEGVSWGEWSTWDNCKRKNAIAKRRRCCFGPIQNRKLSKDKCENLEGSHKQERSCLNQKESTLSTRTENPIHRTTWQTWQAWSRCTNNSRKRVRYCGDAFNRKIKPNRVCKTKETKATRGEGKNGRGVALEDAPQPEPVDTTKQIQRCDPDSVTDVKEDKHKNVMPISRLNIQVSAPECFYPPGTRMLQPAEDDSKPLRIVGGRPSTYGENPHIVMLSYKGFGGYGQFCDGSIIHKRYVLTAAHCFVGWDESPSTYEIVAGAYNKVEKTEKQKTYYLESITCHDSYKVSSRQIIYDVCLLKTTEDIQFNEFVWPICLPDDLPPPNDGSYGRNCTVAGWGDTRFTGDEKVLNEVDVPVLTYDTCVDWYEAENILIDKEQHVCAGYEQGQMDACQGDSGGPFVCRRDTTKIGGQHTDLKVLTGVVSFGVGCAQEKNPGVYTNVYHFLSYIHGIIHKHDSCVDSNPCKNGGVCIDTFHDYTCQCQGNFVGKNCEQHKDTIDACYNNNCQHGTCKVKDDVYECVCFEDYTGRFCDHLTKPCRALDCNSGRCEEDSNGEPYCICDAGMYEGKNCEIDIDECATGQHDCIGEASCNNFDGGYECNCQVGYYGDGLRHGTGCININECTDGTHNCGPQSVCIDDLGSFSCACKKGFIGKPPAVRCQKNKNKVPKCKNFAQETLDTGKRFLVNPLTGKRLFDVACRVPDSENAEQMVIMRTEELLAEGYSMDHPVTKDSEYCQLECSPGYILKAPKSGLDKETGNFLAKCYQTGKKAQWKPKGKQFKCFGCHDTPDNIALSNCKNKGTKSITCDATCKSGKGGVMKQLKCAKFKQTYEYVDNQLESLKAFSANC